MQQIRHRQSGSIFLEVLITLGVLGVTSLGLMFAILAGVQASLLAERSSVAASLAQQEFEILRHLPFDQVPLQSNGSMIGNPQPGLIALPEGTADLTISEHQGDSTLKAVTLDIRFREADRWRTLTFATLIAQGGLND